MTTINMSGFLPTDDFHAEMQALPDSGFGVVLQSMSGVVDHVAFLPSGDTATCVVSGRTVPFVGEAVAEGSAGESVSRSPNGVGAFSVCAPSPGASNVCP